MGSPGAGATPKPPPPSGFSKFLGSAGDSAFQLFIWQVLGQVVSQLGAPFFAALGQAVAETDPNVPLSPADLALMVIRNIRTMDDAAAEAAKSGIDKPKFANLVAATGDSLPPQALAEALRRGFIAEDGSGPDSTAFTQGIREGRLKDKWAPIVQKLSEQLPSPSDALDALLEGQTDHANAVNLYKRFGGDPAYFDLMFNTRGQAPTPVQALELLNRGIIPERGTGPESVSYEQSFLEGPWRNKWLRPFLALARYYPPPRTVTAMYHNGQLTQAQAAHYLTAQGLDAELVAAYLKPAATSKTATDKLLAKTDILGMYEDKLIGKADAAKALVALHYSAHDANLILELADLRVEASQVKSGVSRVRTLYLAGKLTRADALHTLEQLGIAHDQASQSVDLWSLTRSQNTHALTAAEIAGAYHYSLLRGSDAMSLLQHLGYDAFDAWIMLSVRNHSALQDVPRPASPYPAPTPPAAPAPATARTRL